MKDIDAVISPASRPLAYAYYDMVMRLKPYWPLSVRQGYYQMVGEKRVKPTLAGYNSLNNTVSKRLRRDGVGVIPYNAFEDQTRRSVIIEGKTDVEFYCDNFIDENLLAALWHRDYLRTQPLYIEVAIEKKTLISSVQPIMDKYGVNLIIYGGQPSLSLCRDIGMRLLHKQSQGYDVVILNYGDLDPSGLQIISSAKANIMAMVPRLLKYRHLYKGLKPSQIKRFGREGSYAYDTGKATNILWDKMYRGNRWYELDCLDPTELQILIDEDISALIDHDLYQTEVDREIKDRSYIENYRDHIMSLMEDYPMIK